MYNPKRLREAIRARSLINVTLVVTQKKHYARRVGSIQLSMTTTRRFCSWNTTFDRCNRLRPKYWIETAQARKVAMQGVVLALSSTLLLSNSLADRRRSLVNSLLWSQACPNQLNALHFHLNCPEVKQVCHPLLIAALWSHGGSLSVATPTTFYHWPGKHHHSGSGPRSDQWYGSLVSASVFF